MSFARHQTFYLRSGWLAKAIELLPGDPKLFSGSDAPIKLGIGKNMVQSLRFWVVATGLASSGNNGISLTNFGKMVLEHDPYFELDLTWWLIHYHLVTNKDESTSWYFIFNQIPLKEIDRNTFVEIILKTFDNNISVSTLHKDFDCIVSTYVPSEKNQGTPEDNIICPLTRLGLLKSIKFQGVLKSTPAKKLPLEVLYLAIKNASSTTNRLIAQRNISDLLDEQGNIGKVFNLPIDVIYNYLDMLQERGLIQYSRKYDVESITIIDEDPWKLIETAYRYHKKGVFINEA